MENDVVTHEHKEKAQEPVSEIETKFLPKGSLEAILTAEVAMRRDNLSEALSIFSEQVQITQSPSLAITTARLANYLQQYSAAHKAVDIWLTNIPDDLNAQEIKAKVFIYEHKPLISFDYIINKPKLNQELLLVMLVTESLKFNKEDIATLRQRYKQSLLTQANNTGLLIGLSLLEENNDLEYALTLIQQASEINPDSTMVTGIHAALLTQDDQVNEAIALLNQGLLDNPKHFGLTRQLARILSNHDIVAARAVFKELYEKAPQDLTIIFPLAQISMKLEFYAEAEVYLKQLQRMEEYEDYANYNLAIIAEHNKQLFIAMHHYEQIQTSPYLIPSLQRYELIAASLSSSDVFEKHIIDLTKKHPDKQLALDTYHIEFLLRENQYTKAGKLVEKSLEKHPDDSKLLYGRFLIAERQKNYPKAVQSLQYILKQQPDNPVILNALGYTLSRYLDKHQEAKPLIEAALKLKPNDAAIIDSMGWINMRLGNIKDALKLFMVAYGKSTNTDIAAHLGEALWLDKQQSEAIDIWQEAYKNEPDNLELLDALKRFGITLP